MWRDVLVLSSPPPASDSSVWFLVSFSTICLTYFSRIILIYPCPFPRWLKSGVRPLGSWIDCSGTSMLFSFFLFFNWPSSVPSRTWPIRILISCQGMPYTIREDFTFWQCAFQAGALTSVGHACRSVYWVIFTDALVIFTRRSNVSGTNSASCSGTKLPFCTQAITRRVLTPAHR